MARLGVRFSAILFLLVWCSGRAAGDGFGWPRYQKNPEGWFATPEAKRVAENVLSHQSPYGDWPKNIDTGAKPYQGDPKDLDGTFDNSATLGETRFLARMFRATGEPRYQAAMLKSIDHVLEAQYANGGWPQHSPAPARGYYRYITFNDGAMVNIMAFVRDLASSKDFDVLDPGRRRKAQEAFDRGVRCILECQIVVDGRLTVWCAQHDNVTLEPRKARSYEHPSLSGAESAGIVRFLMTLVNPAPDVVRAINASCQWYEDTKLAGICQAEKNGDKVIVQDPAAPPLWARFYQIGANRPIFSGRDGAIKYDIAQIEAERRNGYSWYGEWGKDVAKDYQKWKAAHPQAGTPITALEPHKGWKTLGTAYLFTSFRGNGEDGLHLATSLDGYRWTDMGGPFLTPKVGVSRLMRDPCLLAGPDGVFHMVWTTGWEEKGIGYAQSKDLVHWSEQKYIEVMAREPKTINAWAPELFYDEPNSRFLIFWASTVPGRFPGDDGHPQGRNHRIYYTTTKDFQSFAPTKLLFDPGYSTIDATIVRPSDGAQLMVFKDERREMLRLRTATSDAALGPYRDMSEPFTAFMTEGPSVLRVGDEWIVYFDCYGAKHYEQGPTADFQGWTDITADVSFPKGHRHGTVLKVSQDIVDGLKRAAGR